jgi:GLPGLI family protein
MELGLTSFEIIENLRGTKKGSKDIIISSSNNKTLYLYSVIVANNYATNEPVEKIKWAISRDTTTMLNYKCYKATAHFRGRDWTVWFTPDISVPFGPWKLAGLPGLILKATDSEKHYTFECMSIGKIDRTLQMSDYSKYRTISKKEFDLLLYKLKTEPLAALESKGVRIGTAYDANGRTIDIKQKMKTQYNPIERDDRK